MQQPSRWIRAVAFLPLAASLGCTAPATKQGIVANQPSTFSKIGDSFASMGTAIAAPFKSEKKPTEPVVSLNDPTSLQKKPALTGPEYQVSIASMQESSGNIEGAILAYEKAIDIEPKYVPALMGLAHIYDRQEKYERAIGYYQRAVKAAPTNASAHNDLGLCYCRESKNDLAAAELKKAISLAPERRLYRNNFATVLVELNQPDEAFLQLKEAHGEAAAHYNLGYLLAQKGKNAEASQHLAMALARDPRMKDAQDLLSQINRSPAQIAAQPISAPQQPQPAPIVMTPVQSPRDSQIAVLGPTLPSRPLAVIEQNVDSLAISPLPPVGNESMVVTVTPDREPLDIQPLPPVESSRRINAQPVNFPLNGTLRLSSPDSREITQPQPTTPRNELRLLPADDS